VRAHHEFYSKVRIGTKEYESFETSRNLRIEEIEISNLEITDRLVLY